MINTPELLRGRHEMTTLRYADWPFVGSSRDMTPGVFVTGSEPASGKSAVALGVQQLLARRIGRLGVFRPVVAHPEHAPILDLLRPNGADFVPYAASYGVGYAEVRADEER